MNIKNLAIFGVFAIVLLSSGNYIQAQVVDQKFMTQKFTELFNYIDKQSAAFEKRFKDLDGHIAESCDVGDDENA